MKYVAFFILILINQNLPAQDAPHYAKPVFISNAASRVQINSFYSYVPQAMDSAGLPLSFSVKKLPGWLQYNAATNTISGTTSIAGQYPVQIEVSNQHTTAVQNFMLTVYNNQTENILCLGNSLTNGTSKYNSYRRDLWQMLHAANYNFDFIGSWNKHHGGAGMPNDDFDTDHEGHSGWTIGHMFTPPDWDSARGNINKWLIDYKPDIVLIELGTNDVFQCVKIPGMLANLDQLVKTLRKKNALVKIFIAQIPPLGVQWAPKKLCGDSVAYETVLKDFNKQVKSYSQKTTTKLSLVKAVDQFTGVNPATGMYDDIHPNDKGEKLMAQRWFEAIRTHLKKLP